MRSETARSHVQVTQYALQIGCVWCVWYACVWGVCYFSGGVLVAPGWVKHCHPERHGTRIPVRGTGAVCMIMRACRRVLLPDGSECNVWLGQVLLPSIATWCALPSTWGTRYRRYEMYGMSACERVHYPVVLLVTPGGVNCCGP